MDNTVKTRRGKTRNIKNQAMKEHFLRFWLKHFHSIAVIKGKSAVCVKLFSRMYAIGFWFIEEQPF